MRRLKLDALRKMGSGGQHDSTGEHAHRANAWLARAKSSGKVQFAGRVYEPLMVTIDVTNPDDAVYLENCIGKRDLAAVGAEEVSDANMLMTRLREEEKLKVGVVHLDPSDHPGRD